MELRNTLIALAVCVAASALFGWIGARPWDPRKGPRMTPWPLLMLLAAAAAFFVLVHAVNLMGVTTGR